MRASLAHIAGVGISGTADSPLHELALSAGAKALLDAGVTYSDIDQSVACSSDEKLRVPRSVFDTFGLNGAPVCEVDNQSALFTAVQCIRSGQRNCALILGTDRVASNNSRDTQVVAVAIVLVSNLFLTSHAYLKDSAAAIRACYVVNRVHTRSLGGSKSLRPMQTAVQHALRQAQLEAKDIQIVETQLGSNQDARQALSNFHDLQTRGYLEATTFHGTAELAGLCELVWQLRGWAHDRAIPQVRNCLQCTSDPDGSASVTIICRSDGRVAPAWSDTKDVREGRERLGYNPAVEKRGIALEDLEAVRAREASTASADAIKQLQVRLPIKGGDRASLARL